jgi:hypothetical protein
MGKQSQAKKERLFNNSSIENIANAYLDASPARAKLMRMTTAKQYISQARIGPRLIPFRELLSTLPSCFVNAYSNLLGHTMVGARHEDFWPEIVENLLIITTGIENERALIEWGKDASSHASWVKGFCYASLQQMAESMAPARAMLLLKESLEKGLNNIFFDAIPTHLVTSSAIAQNKVIKKSGSLILFFQGDEVTELWLVKKRLDNVYAVSAEARDGSLQISEVREMRAFVNKYNGQTFKGRLSPGREKNAARICSIVGLKTDGKYAWLEGNH